MEIASIFLLAMQALQCVYPVCSYNPLKQFPFRNLSIHLISLHSRTSRENKLNYSNIFILYNTIHNFNNKKYYTSSATAADAVNGLSKSTYVFNRSLGSGYALFMWIVKSSIKLNLANYKRIATTCSFNSGCRFNPKSVVLSPPFSDTNQSHEAVRRLPSPNSNANLENNLAVH